jgi:hypothetical protein
VLLADFVATLQAIRILNLAVATTTSTRKQQQQNSFADFVVLERRRLIIPHMHSVRSLPIASRYKMMQETYALVEDKEDKVTTIR